MIYPPTQNHTAWPASVFYGNGRGQEQQQEVAQNVTPLKKGKKEKKVKKKKKKRGS